MSGVLSAFKGVRVVHECVHASDECKSPWTTIDLSVNLKGNLPCIGLEPRKTCASAGNVQLWTMCWKHLPSVTGRLPSLVADPRTHFSDPTSSEKKILCLCFAPFVSWLQDDQVFHLLSSLHHNCKLSSRQEFLPAR